MGSNPINLALRFFLELAAWFAMGYWGWTQNTGVPRFAAAIGLPLAAMALWGVFRVPGEPNDDPPVAVPGIVRLIIELGEFSLAVGLLYLAGRTQLALIFGAVILLHYAASYDYIIRILRYRGHIS